MNSLRERFIEDTRRSTDVRRDHHGLDYRTSSHKGQEGRFLDQRTHQMWLGYQLAHTAAYHDDKVENEESILMGRYVVMNRVGPGVKVKSSHHPFVHRGRKAAIDEADRLTQEHSSEFVVFRCVAARAPKTIIEDTTNA